MSIEERPGCERFLCSNRSDKQRLLALVAEDIEWIVPGEDWPLAGTHRVHRDFGGRGSESVRSDSKLNIQSSRIRGRPRGRPGPGRRRLATGENQSPRIRRSWTIGSSTITVRNGKLTNIREYVDTQALARSSNTAVSPRNPDPIDTDTTRSDRKGLRNRVAC